MTRCWQWLTLISRWWWPGSSLVWSGECRAGTPAEVPTPWTSQTVWACRCRSTVGNISDSPQHLHSAEPPVQSSAPCNIWWHKIVDLGKVFSKKYLVLTYEECLVDKREIILLDRWKSRQFCSILRRIFGWWCWGEWPGLEWSHSRPSNHPCQRWPQEWHLKQENILNSSNHENVTKVFYVLSPLFQEQFHMIIKTF